MSRFRRSPKVRRARLSGDVLAETPRGGVVMQLEQSRQASDGIVTVLLGSEVAHEDAVRELRLLARKLKSAPRIG